MTDVLYVVYAIQRTYDPTLGELAVMNFTAPEYYGGASIPNAYVGAIGGSLNLSSTPYPTFPTLDAMMAYYKDAGAEALRVMVNTVLGSPYFTSYDAEQSDHPAFTLALSKSTRANFSGVAALSAHGVANASGGASTTQTTNYNLVSGVLGLANGLNDANTAQNDLATKYNDLASKFNSVLTWLGTNKDKINATITAGAA